MNRNCLICNSDIEGQELGAIVKTNLSNEVLPYNIIVEKIIEFKCEHCNSIITIKTQYKYNLD